jgi:hypothetical protein
MVHGGWEGHVGRMITVGLLAVLGGGGLALPLAQDAPTRPPTANGAAPAAADGAAPAAALDPVIDKILMRLEQRQIESLQADVRWRLHYLSDEPEDDVIRVGEIFYKHERPVGWFLLRFARRIIGNTSKNVAEQHLFDGVWYVKLDEERRSIERVQVREPDDPLDPFKLGQGPFPVPFGQSKQSILQEFVVARIDPAPDDPPSTDHLKLTPREGTRTAETYRYVHFWIAREGPEAGLPVKVRAGKLKPTGQLDADITVTFTNPRLNPGLSASVFKIETPRGFDETVQPLAPIDPGRMPTPAPAAPR